jgi:hypothetical protein
MSIEKITTKSTSSVSADTNDILLRETTITRLIFRPQLVTNNNNPQASVKGIFIFQRKGKNDVWEIVNEMTLANLKNGEGTKLYLHSEGLLKFYQGITKLYELYDQHGLPQGNQTFINITNRLQAVASLSDDDFKQLVETGNDVGVKALLRLLKWASNVKDISAILDQLESLDINSLQHIRTFSGIATLHDALRVWGNNSTNSSEQFWQDQFTKRSFLLEQIFSYPVLLIKAKAYMGGKSIYNDGANYGDFLYKHALTSSAILVEIKTPTTPLLGPEYRDGIYNASAQLTGAILQVLDYRKSLTEEFRILRKNDDIDMCDPPCKVIIGNISELNNAEKKKSFELFRRHFNGVEVLTYDEVFLRISNLLRLLEGKETDDIIF